jgi:hypothetical protein
VYLLLILSDVSSIAFDPVSELQSAKNVSITPIQRPRRVLGLGTFAGSVHSNALIPVLAGDFS